MRIIYLFHAQEYSKIKAGNLFWVLALFDVLISNRGRLGWNIFRRITLKSWVLVQTGHARTYRNISGGRARWEGRIIRC